MPQLFDKTETGFTATAGQLAVADGQEIDFSRWGTPDRAKINEGLSFANLYFWRTRGAL